jgi:release factor glutamine methyltransferase
VIRQAAVPVREALDSALIALTASGVDTPRLDAEVLLAWAMGVDRARLLMSPELPVAGPAARVFRDAVRRRSAEREPVAYITGVKGFRHIDLRVDGRVLIPRPETEHLVEAALGLPPGTHVHDVGTGSGAVALALAHERPDLRVTGSDVSAGALDVARANAAALGLDVEFSQADLLDGAPPADVVLANLPYVQDGAPLAPEIVRHEPRGALFAGADGLDCIRRLVAQLAQVPARLVGLEVGEGQAGDVSALLARDGWRAESVRDLAGIERIVVGQR